MKVAYIIMNASVPDGGLVVPQQPARMQIRRNIMKQNCWEFKKCGREPGGMRAHELGTCPAATDYRLDGVHDGRNAGRACWVLAGTFCGGRVQGTFAQKFPNCGVCDFYKVVRAEESGGFQYSNILMDLLKKIPASPTARGEG